MTRKRARKLMMAEGYSRNQANALLDPAVRPYLHIVVTAKRKQKGYLCFTIQRLKQENELVLDHALRILAI